MGRVRALHGHTRRRGNSTLVLEAAARQTRHAINRRAGCLERGSGLRFVRRIRMPAEHGIEHEKPDHVGERDVPAVLEPQADRFRLRVHVRQRNAGLRHSGAMRIAAHSPAPMNGKRSEYALNFTLTITLTTIAASRMDATIATRGQSTRTPAAAPCVIGE